MIKTTAMILDELNEYGNPPDKLSRLVKKGEYIQIVKGLYETDKSTPGYLLAGSIYGPSYISFEFALSYHGMIPEAVFTFTCATFEKKKKKKYTTPFGNYTYRDIPSGVFYYGQNIIKEGEYSFIIASPEKALCDQLYKSKPVNNYKELEKLIFEDLRIDEQMFQRLNLDDIRIIAGKYGSRNIKKLNSYLRRK